MLKKNFLNFLNINLENIARKMQEKKCLIIIYNLKILMHINKKKKNKKKKLIKKKLSKKMKNKNYKKKIR